LGAAPEPIPQRKLTAGALLRAIRAATTDGRMRGRAAELGEKVRAERGVALAVKIIESAVV
jgi:sterol 3beta-glucosyltransferase